MRMSRFLNRPRPAVALLAAGLATAFLGALATLGPTDTDADTRGTAPTPRPTTTATATALEDPLVVAYNAGWTAGVAALGDSTRPTYPNVTGDGSNPGTIAWADGWIDGQADALGDDNRDGIVDEDESGWDCATMGNRQCGPTDPAAGAVAAPLECEHNDAPTDVFRLCLTVAARPGGPEGIAALPQTPGTPAWADALRALDREQRNA
ncbi:hypothetical protein [Streptomyces hirsutus]|uniref:hypothetical protein n=1 Tax=Streptomyces hirsutus TaxID=35620 RepID=UPI00332FAFE8